MAKKICFGIKLDRKLIYQHKLLIFQLQWFKSSSFPSNFWNLISHFSSKLIILRNNLSLDFNKTLDFINTYQENYIWPSCIGLITQACMHAICCILLMVGVYLHKKIMIPYMIFSIFRFFVYFGFGTAISVGFYYIQGKMFFGVAAVIFLFLLIFGLKTIYFLLTIRKAYQYHEIYNLQNSKIMSRVLHRYTSHVSQTSGQIGKYIFFPF